MLKKLTGTLLLGAMLVLCASAVMAQPVIFDVKTSTGNDTLYVGIPGSIRFTVDANGVRVASLTFALTVHFSAGNIIGPLGAGVGPNNVVPSAAATGAFESISWNPGYGAGTDPDTMLYGFVDFGGPLWNISGEVFRINVTPSGTGTIRFDSARHPGIPPANLLSAVDDGANNVPISWLGEGKLIHVVVKPNIPPVCTGTSGFPSVAVFGDLITGQINASDPDGTPNPLSYLLKSATNSNGTGPNNAIVISATGGVSWQTSNANNDDVGIWTLVFCVTDGKDTVQCPPRIIEVIAEKPLVCFSLGSAETFSNSSVCVELRADNFFNPCKELGGFDLLFTYDQSILTFTGLDLTGSVLVADAWEYLTYRVVSTNPGMIRIVAIADMNNSNQHPRGFCANGLLALLCFKTSNDRTVACQSAALRFFWNDCGDNTASSKSGNELYIIADPRSHVAWFQGPWVGGNAAAGIPGGGIIENSQAIKAQIATMQGGVTGPAAMPCPNPDPRKPQPVQCLYFVNGKIKIRCPGDIDDRGDINLNGLAYEIADAVLYSNYFIFGPGVFGPPGVNTTEAKIAASDVNADGRPLTVADLVYLIRVITGDAQPIAGDLLGGGPKIAAVVGKLDVTAAHQGALTTVKAQSELDLGAAHFVFRYENTQITDVALLGRARGMDLEHHAENGELKVLVFNIQDRAKIHAGSGEILSVTTTGGGQLELVSVEAASFMGGALDATVSAKIVPTAYALHQNFPNPFNPSTSMALDLPKASDYKLTIYNIAGQVVKTYAGHSEAGTVKITWDGTNAQGAKVASGVYFYSAQAEAFSAVRKMVLMK